MYAGQTNAEGGEFNGTVLICLHTCVFVLMAKYMRVGVAVIPTRVPASAYAWGAGVTQIIKDESAYTQA